jgi:C-terminal processing protease CtpA/Prc
MLSILTLALAPLAAIPAQADVAPDYPEYHAGIQIEETKDYPAVSAVAAKSPAETAGVKKGDAILAMNGGYAKTNVPFYFFAKGLRGPRGSVLSLVLLRDGREVLVVNVNRTIAVR